MTDAAMWVVPGTLTLIILHSLSECQTSLHVILLPVSLPLNLVSCYVEDVWARDGVTWIIYTRNYMSQSVPFVPDVSAQHLL